MDSNKLIDAIVAGEQDQAIAFAEGISYFEGLNMVSTAMEIVGEKYESGEFFIPEMLMSAEVAKSVLNYLQSLAPETNQTERKEIKAVIGTARGDIHDIGKSIVISLLTASGIKVIDLGVNVAVDKFINAVKEHFPQFLMMSSLTTASLNSMKKVIAELEALGLRKNLKIFIGGAAVNEEIMKQCGADVYSNNTTGMLNFFTCLKKCINEVK